MVNSERTNVSLTWRRLLLIVVLPLLSGAAALSHELLWTRRLVDLLGATDWVIGRVLGLFFFGISVGGFLAALPSKRIWPPVYRLASAEFCVAVLALPAAFLPYWTDWIWAALGTEPLGAWQGGAIKFVLASLVVLPPAIAMGFTLPYFVRAATEVGSNVASVGIWIYALNTFGGVLGLWFTSTWLLQRCGAQWAMIAIAAVNGLIAFFALMLGMGRLKEPDDSKQGLGEAEKSKEPGPGAGVGLETALDRPDRSGLSLIMLSFVSGFVVLSLEVLLLRLIALVVPSSYHTTSALLANVILILAVSSALVSLSNSNGKLRKFVRSRRALALGFAGATLFIALSPIILFESTDKLMSIRYLQGLNDRTIESVSHYWLLVFWLVAVCGGLALFFSGLVFPSIMTMSSEVDPTGEKLGLLLAANGIGGLIGSELSNWLLIGTVGIYPAFSVLALIAFVCGIAVLFREGPLWAIATAAGLAIVVFVGHRYASKLPYFSPRSKTKFNVLATHFGREGAMLVVEDSKKSRSILVNGQYILGSSGVAQDQRRQILFPWILHPEAESVCSLGLATGISASGFGTVENPPPITAIELSANVEQLARTYFEDESGGFFDDPQNKVVIEDARTYIAAARDQFDLIVGDLYRPHGTGEGRLFTVEHFENVRRALTNDGLYCQWLPVYQLNADNFLIIAATFQKVFPETLVIFGNQTARYPVIGLVGRKNDDGWQADQVKSKFDNIPTQVIENDPVLSDVLGMVVGVLKSSELENQPVNTLDNMLIEIAAGDFWILKDLRRDRKSSIDTEFLHGKYLIEFNQRLAHLTRPVFPRSHFVQFNKTLMSELILSK